MGILERLNFGNDVRLHPRRTLCTGRMRSKEGEGLLLLRLLPTSSSRVATLRSIARRGLLLRQDRGLSTETIFPPNDDPDGCRCICIHCRHGRCCRCSQQAHAQGGPRRRFPGTPINVIDPINSSLPKVHYSSFKELYKEKLYRKYCIATLTLSTLPPFPKPSPLPICTSHHDGHRGSESCTIQRHITSHTHLKTESELDPDCWTTPHPLTLPETVLPRAYMM